MWKLRVLKEFSSESALLKTHRAYQYTYYPESGLADILSVLRIIHEVIGSAHWKFIQWKTSISLCWKKHSKVGDHLKVDSITCDKDYNSKTVKNSKKKQFRIKQAVEKSLQ